MSRSSRRVTDHPVLGPAGPGRRVSFEFDGRSFVGVEGEPVAIALLAAGIRTLRRSERTGRPRGLFCVIGHCFECRMTVDDRRGVRACLLPLREGMIVRSQGGPTDG